MPDRLLRSPVASAAGPILAGALERAAAAIARLDQALVMHPLRPAFLHRARLEAVRRQAGVDGQAIDPWHLAAVLEGLRLRMDHALRIIDRGMIFEAACTDRPCDARTSTCRSLANRSGLFAQLTQRLSLNACGMGVGWSR
jgi:hypothetical protein